MILKNLPLFVLTFALFLSTACVFAAEPATPKAAIFVRTVNTPELQALSQAFLQQVRSRVDGRGFSLMSRGEITDAIERAPAQTDLGAMLASEASALRLAQLLGADYLLVANLLGIAEEVREYDGPDIQTRNRTYILRTSYTLADASAGGGITGNAIEVRKTLRDTPTLKITHSGVTQDLVDQAAAKIAAALIDDRESGRIADAPVQAEPVTFSVSARLQDIALPDIQLDENGQAHVSAETFPVRATGVTVELDGVTLGSTPGEFEAMPGLHVLRLQRDGFEPWERNVNLYDGFELEAALEFTPRGLRRWQQTAAFLQSLKDTARLTDAEVEVLKGKARALEQSGFRVDTREAPRIDIYTPVWDPYPRR